MNSIQFPRRKRRWFYLYRIVLLLCAFFIVKPNGWAQGAKRIVSLASSLTKNIYYLDAGHQLVGCTNYCFEALNDSVPIVASAIKVNIEKVLSVEPDIVLATKLTNPETIQQLEKFGLDVEVFPTPASFPELCEQFEHIGELLGRSGKARAIVSQSIKTVDSLRNSIAWESSPNIFFQIGAKPIFTVLSKTYMDDYITYLKGKNIAASLTKGTIGREAVLVKNPDVIFVTTMGLLGEQEKLNWMKYSQVNAAKNGKVFVVDSQLACTPTPITFVKTFEILVNYLQP